MPKVRVYEIAKQLNINSKVLAEKLTDFGIEGKNHMSTLDDSEATRVMNSYRDGAGKAAQGDHKPEQEPVKKPVTEGPADVSKTPQPASVANGERRQEQRSPEQRQEQKSQGQRPEQGMQGQRSEQRPQGQRPDQRPQGQRPEQRPQGQRPDQRPQGQRPEQRPQGQRPQGQRPDQRPQGQRSEQGYQGQRPDQRPQGQRPDQRPQGQRSEQGYQGQRPDQRPQGQRPDQRPQGQRPDQRYQGQRPQGQGQGTERYREQRQSDETGAGTGNRPYEQRQGQYRTGQSRPQGQGQGQSQRPQQGGGTGYRPASQNSGGTGYRPASQNSGGTGYRPASQNSGGTGYRPASQNSGGTGYRPASQNGGPTGSRPVYNKDKDDYKGNNQKGQRPGQKPNPSKSKAPEQKGDTKDEQKQRFEQKQKFRAKPQQKGELKKEKGKPVSAAPIKKPIPKPIVKKVEEIKIIHIPQVLTIKELAAEMRKSGAEIIKSLMKKGIMVTLNQEIDFETASKIAEGFDIITEEIVEVDLLEQAFMNQEDKEEDKRERPPVVVVMGHVDHGKTSLLDSIRHSNVTTTEAGGITQHIGAYTVSIDGKPITFLDTPGHEAFTAMRMRGALVTDIAVLVVAADDGVMPQTIEAINHAKAANVEIIVAINKIDKPSANPDKVKQELTEYGLLAEEWGGETICVPVSATSRTGIDHLLEMIIIAAEMKELRANPNKRARGTIVEALLDKGRGPVATVLVQDGTLKIGDPVIVGGTFGKVRAMIDDKGRKVKTAGPSVPVEVIGLSDVPLAGDLFYVANNEKEARQLSEGIIAKGRLDLIKDTPQKISLDDLFTQIKSGTVKDLNIVVKADVQGSAEAIKTSLEKLSNEEVRIRIIHGGVGAITESDVMLASASNAIIIGFNVRPEAAAKSVAEDEKVDVRLYRIIYNAIEDISLAMKGMLEPIYKEKVMGHAEIRQIFKASSIGTIGGSYVIDGKLARNNQVRIVRDGKVIYDGHFESLRRHKDDVKEVNTGYECGLLFSKYNDIKEGDVVEAYIMEEIPR